MNGLSVLVVLAVVGCVMGGDMMRKSIVFDKATPEVFYCPLDKPTSFEKMYVRSRPLANLCQFEGKGLPDDYKSDCYNDVDESEYACKEKKRIMMRRESDEAEQEQMERARPNTSTTTTNNNNNNNNSV